jgi:hypothetical protein
MSNSDIANANFRNAVASQKVTDDLVRIVVEVPPGYRRAVKTLAAAEDCTIKDIMMEGIERVCKDRNVPIRN